jgi:hypothetical protein
MAPTPQAVQQPAAPPAWGPSGAAAAAAGCLISLLHAARPGPHRLAAPAHSRAGPARGRLAPPAHGPYEHLGTRI